MSETLYGLLIARRCWPPTGCSTRPSAGRAVVLGAVAALAALTRGEALLLLPLVLIPVVWRRGAWQRDGVRAAGVALVAFLVVLTPWTVRNWIVFDRPVAIATNSGTAVAGRQLRRHLRERRPASAAGTRPASRSTRARTRPSTTRRRCKRRRALRATTTWAACRSCWLRAWAGSGASTSRSRSPRAARCGSRRSA